MTRRALAATVFVVTAVITAAACSTSTDGQAEQTVCDPDPSVVRIWNEAALDAIRRDFPAPTVHARNLFHLSAVSWDVWAAYDDDATAVFVDRQLDVDGDDREQARNVAISYASYRLLTHRYELSIGAEESLAQFDETMERLCLDIDLASIPDGSAAAVGLEIAQTVIDETRNDGSNEPANYVDLTYAPSNPAMVVSQSGTEMVDPNRWQPLSLGTQVTQNGLELPSGVQEFIGPSWGFVTPFALDPDPDDGLPIDPGPPPLLGVDDDGYVGGAIEVVRLAGLLDPTQSEIIDIGPGAQGNAPLGTDDGAGHDENPATGQPYEPNPVLHADYGRAIAEYWADGPDSETPPGHWNTIANDVSDRLAAAGELRIGGEGEVVNRLEWDVKLALALNGAHHDAAIAAWGAKGFYDYVRPISMIRFLGQGADFPDTPGLIETITAESSAPSERHAHLADAVGEQAVWSWLGTPDDVENEIAGVGWMRAADWVPYQRPTFVTPSFSAYVSGHSTFSRAAAEVLTNFTGSPFFPGGLAEHTVDALIHEAGPTEPVALQWATYRDAADEAGRSRLYGGIHVPADDLLGREMGATIGLLAWEEAQSSF